MTETIWKFPLRQTGLMGEFVAAMPNDAQVLSVSWQEETFVIWAIVDPRAKTEDRYFFALGTGHDIPSQAAAFRYGAKLVGRVEIRANSPALPALMQFHVFDTGIWRPALETPDMSAKVEMPRG